MSGLPRGWQLARLDELCEWGSGGTPRRSEQSYFGGQFPWITISDLNDGKVTNTAENLTEAGIVNSAAKLVPVGTVLVALYGSIGKLGITTQLSTTNQAIACALPNEQAFDALFLFHYLRSKRHQLGLQGTGVTQKNIYLGDIKAFDIPVAPRTEQTRIVAKLEELLSDLDAGVAELKAAQKKLAQYRQSLLKAAVEGALTAEWRKQHPVAESGAQLLARILQERRARWEAKQLAKFAEQGKTPPKDWQKKYPEPVQPDTTDLPPLPEGWVWASVDCLLSDIETGKSFKCEERPPHNHEVGVVKVSAVSWGEYNEQESKTCHDESMIHPELFVKAGDFLFSRANTIELVGACVIVKAVAKRVMLSDKILRFVLVHEELKTWLLTLLRSDFGRQYIERLASGNQESMRNIGQERLRQIPLPLPSLEEVTKASELLSVNILAAKEQELAIDRSLKQSAAQRQNILRAAFAGQLVPQDPNDEPASVLLERIRAERAQRAATPKARGRKV